jgi:myo-inositol-1(or 4)-monophosphatase
VLLVQEAGGQVTDFAGGRDFIFGRQVVATNQFIHQELLEAVGEHWGTSAQ